ncbi:YdcF family protein [Komagataeibacter oboediens]|uniref:YdcF family protein n=1 Tax=Komagataeibacter oboediens TaxID=65958 RepID=UPI001C2DD0BC|nr:YdcF family protein [Komagataeibacter oboediens]MBV1824346.1 YdcF family protein [Komagataeibacter oboediens]
MSKDAFPEGIIECINEVVQFLAVDDFSSVQNNMTPDLVILAGNDFLPGAEGAFRLAKRKNVPLLISGGVGHATDFLRQAVARNTRYHTLDTAGLSEAEILHSIATTFWGLPSSQILLETRATNGGENGQFTRKLLEERHITPKTVVLVQDPAMQRRAAATFQQTWHGMTPACRIFSWPVVVPQLMLENGKVVFSGPEEDHPASLERFISLVMGEIPRLRDDENGYGPKGKGFIPHIEIPHSTEKSFYEIISYFNSNDKIIKRSIFK